MGKEVTSTSGQMTFCNFYNGCNYEREWMIISSTMSPTQTKPGRYSLLDPKEVLSKKVPCKVLHS